MSETKVHAKKRRQDWKERYRDKVVTAKEAVASVKHGQRIFIGSGAAEPKSLVEALSKRKDLTDTEIVHILRLGTIAYADPGLGNRFRHNAFFIGPNVRENVKQGRADYTPIFLSEIPHLFRTKRVVLDVAFIEVSPPDEHGNCSYGVSTDIVKAAAESAIFVVAEVNSQMPRTLGECFIHINDIDRLVPSDCPIPEAPPMVPDETAERIAKRIARLIEDGSTLQLGIGSIPEAVLQHLGHFKNLGIHTEMFSDSLLPLIDSGVINNQEKQINRGKVVASFVIGTRKLYDYVDNNPMVEFRPTEYVSDPFTIARNDKVISINSALEVDLTGQVCSDSHSSKFYSGIGGQMDFIRGAARSKGGKPIITLRSTADNHTYSRIVPFLKAGVDVVANRADIHYVVTEYGTAYLHGKSLRERALALIQIAHPKFRPWLISEAKARELIYANQVEFPLETPIYPEEIERWITAKDGVKFFLRPLKLTDESLLRDLFYKLSKRTIQNRFFASIKSMGHDKLQEFLRVDYSADMAVVVQTDATAEATIVGIAHYSNDPRTNYADAAFLVRDDYQGKGIGLVMLETLIQHAIQHHIAGFTADVLAENSAMLKVFYKCPYFIESQMEEGVYTLTIDFTKAKKDPPIRELRTDE